MAKRHEYPQSRSISSRLQCITEALSFTLAVLMTMRDLPGTSEAMKNAAQKGIDRLELAMKAASGDDE